ncbi:MAG: GDP-mannose 4,6-dehydratase, partial [Nanoarchaeota archaeon]|nr:GDP-mannose 4,6-dehydratase [Nanoarchaeota archaeon]
IRVHGKNGQIYNIAGKNELPNIEITKMMLKEMGKDDSSIEYVKDRPGHDRRYSLDITKLEKLGWKPKFSFASALPKTIRWYEQNGSWWRKLK